MKGTPELDPDVEDEAPTLELERVAPIRPHSQRL